MRILQKRQIVFMIHCGFNFTYNGFNGFNGLPKLLTIIRIIR